MPEVLSAALGARSGTNVVFELKEAPLLMLDILDMVDAGGSPILDTSGQSAPAAAIICGLNGLAEDVLPFLDL